MQDIKALVVRNDLQLEQDKIQQLLSLLRQNSLSYLSPEKEAGPFLLYCCGDDLKTIATKTNLPLEIILLTAINYRWPEKAQLLQKDITAQSITDLQKDMARSLLVATYISMQKQLGDVIAGRADPKTCGLIPKNMQGLERLMTMINDLTAPKATPSKSANTSVHAQNVQIVNNNNDQKQIEEPKIEKRTPEEEAEHQAMLDALGDI